MTQVESEQPGWRDALDGLAAKLPQPGDIDIELVTLCGVVYLCVLATLRLGR
jgi:hypothetical protein